MLNLVKVLFVIGVAGLCQGDCDAGCKVPLTHYKEMGCKPIYKEQDACCPAYFDCSDFHARSKDKCYYKGKVYNLRESLSSDLTAQNCLAACFCADSGTFTCAHIDCPEFFGSSPLKQGCYRAYEHKSCCSTGNHCPPFENLAKCEVAGKTYYEGQRFDAPGAKNLNCICQKNFAGKFEEPFCHPINCGLEILHSDSFGGNCAPIYYGNDRICPIQWQCNENVVSILISKQNKGIDKKCKFNDKELNVGDIVILKKPYEHSPEINCECLIPPIVTCIQKPHET